MPWSLLIPSCHLFSASGAEILHWTSLLAVGILLHPEREKGKNRGVGKGEDEVNSHLGMKPRNPVPLKAPELQGLGNFVVYVVLIKKKINTTKSPYWGKKYIKTNKNTQTP